MLFVHYLSQMSSDGAPRSPPFFLGTYKSASNRALQLYMQEPPKMKRRQSQSLLPSQPNQREAFDDVSSCLYTFRLFSRTSIFNRAGFNIERYRSVPGHKTKHGSYPTALPLNIRLPNFRFPMNAAPVPISLGFGNLIQLRHKRN